MGKTSEDPEKIDTRRVALFVRISKQYTDRIIWQFFLIFS